MEILQQAIRAVQRNLHTLGLYLLVTFAANAVGVAAFAALGSPGESALGKELLFLCGLGIDVCFALVYSVAQAILFSRIAKDIDRPVWRIRDDREALRRYFFLWLILNGCVYLLKQLSSDVPALLDNQEIGFIPSLLLLFATAVYIPLGAAMMFQGTVKWRGLPEALSPYRRQFAKAFLLCCFGGILFLLMILLVERTESQPWLRVVIGIIFNYFDCVIFCAAWLICMLDRQNPEDAGFEF